MIDLKVINSVIEQMEQEKGIPKAKMLEAIEMALATAYKKEYGKRGQIIKAKVDLSSGKMEFIQVKTVVDKDSVLMREEKGEDKEADEKFRRSKRLEEEKEELNEAGEKIVYYNPEHHIFVEDAKKIKKDAAAGLAVIARTVEENMDARTLAKLLIHRLRVVLLLRYAPDLAKSFAQELTEADLALAQELSKEPGVNSDTQRALLEAYSQMAYAAVPHLPLELAIIDICAAK